ncbi:hypothetical protein H0H87_012615, partial [Tephrocybe sp. NHM501043]
VNAHAKELRDKFVAHEGKKQLTVYSDSWTMAGMDFGGLSIQMTGEVQKNVKDPSLVPRVIPVFTTTTPHDSVICLVPLMSTLKDYQMMIECGLPFVTLEGTQDDWRSILTRVDKLHEFGDEPTEWAGMHRAILFRSVRAFDAGGPEADKEFWERIVHEERGSGTVLDWGMAEQGDHRALADQQERGVKRRWPDAWGLKMKLDGIRIPRSPACPDVDVEVIDENNKAWDLGCGYINRRERWRATAMLRIKRKPPPTQSLGLDLPGLDIRYPTPDPADPFAPLWVLRTRRSNASLKADVLKADVKADVLKADVLKADVLKADALKADVKADALKADVLDAQPHSTPHKRSYSTPPSALFAATHDDTPSSFIHISHISSPSLTPEADDALAFTDPRPAPSPASHTLSSAQLKRAAALPLVAPSGIRVSFLSLFADRPTIIIFLRHFWCPHSQDYASDLPRPTHAPVVLITNGPPAYIDKYRAMLGLTSHMYADPTGELYDALGMSRTNPTDTTKHPPTTGSAKRSTVGALATVVVRALKAGLPVWERAGDVHQLGGEFVLGPGLKCSYAHRMQSPNGHAPLREVFAAAGVELPGPSQSRPITPLPLLGNNAQAAASTSTFTFSSAQQTQNQRPPSLIKQYASSLLRKPNRPTKGKENQQENQQEKPPTSRLRKLGKSLSTRAAGKSTSASASASGSAGPSEFGAWRAQTRRAGSLDSGRMLALGLGRGLGLETRTQTRPGVFTASGSEPHAHAQARSESGHPSPSPYPSPYPSRASAASPPPPPPPPSHAPPPPPPPRIAPAPARPPSSRTRTSIDSDLPDWTFGMEDEAAWMRARMRSLEVLRERKKERRGVFVGYFVSPGTGSESGSEEGERGRRRASTSTSTRACGCGVVREEEEEEVVEVAEFTATQERRTRSRAERHLQDPDISDVMVVGFGRDEDEVGAGAGAGVEPGDESWTAGCEDDGDEIWVGRGRGRERDESWAVGDESWVVGYEEGELGEGGRYVAYAYPETG